MEQKLSISAKGISKVYRLGLTPSVYGRLSEVLWDRLRGLFIRDRNKSNPGDTTLWALRDVNFEVARGEIVGVIGRNGAGKSTLLKILSRITRPTEGFVELRGRVGSLLEVGTGFHPELTGRENVYLNGTILGMKKSEIDSKFEEIVEFAELSRFIDTPVKRYSSGMYVRLAFAVAAHLEPEILLVDEVLSVGDVSFQRKCLGRMGQVGGQGRTIVFVSHNLAALESLCSRAYLLESGKVTAEGRATDVVRDFLSSLQTTRTSSLADRQDRRGNGRLKLTEINFLGGDKGQTPAVQCGQPLQIVVDYLATQPPRSISLYVGIFAMNGQCMLILNNEMVGKEFEVAPTSGRIICQLPKLALAPGQYYVNLYCEVGTLMADWIQHAAELTVDPGDFFGTGRLPPETHGGVLVPQTWTMSPGE